MEERPENGAQEPSADILALDEALSSSSKFDARKNQVVELKFFGVLHEEKAIAGVIKISLRTVQCV
jgi:hypothetical protein